jgi:hypothetical protein
MPARDAMPVPQIPMRWTWRRLWGMTFFSGERAGTGAVLAGSIPRKGIWGRFNLDNLLSFMGKPPFQNVVFEKQLAFFACL